MMSSKYSKSELTVKYMQISAENEKLIKKDWFGISKEW